jgi:hypothetical protein
MKDTKTKLKPEKLYCEKRVLRDGENESAALMLCETPLKNIEIRTEIEGNRGIQTATIWMRPDSLIPLAEMIRDYLQTKTKPTNRKDKMSENSNKLEGCGNCKYANDDVHSQICHICRDYDHWVGVKNWEKINPETTALTDLLRRLSEMDNRASQRGTASAIRGQGWTIRR